MHCQCGTNKRAPRWIFTDLCKPEVRPGTWEESASPAWLAAPAMNARNTMKVYIWRLDTGCGPTHIILYIFRKHIISVLNNKTNHPISSNSHPSATANKAIHSLKMGGGVNKQREHHIISIYNTTFSCLDLSVWFLTVFPVNNHRSIIEIKILRQGQ